MRSCGVVKPVSRHHGMYSWTLEPLCPWAREGRASAMSPFWAGNGLFLCGSWLMLPRWVLPSGRDCAHRGVKVAQCFSCYAWYSETGIEAGGGTWC